MRSSANGPVRPKPPITGSHITHAEEAADSQGYTNHSVNNNTFIARKPEVHHRGHNSPPLDHILSQLNPVHILSTHLKTRCNVTFSPAPTPCKWSYRSVFSDKYCPDSFILKRVLRVLSM